MGYNFQGDFNPLAAAPPDDTPLGNVVLDSLFSWLKYYGYKGTRTGVINAMAVASDGRFLPNLVNTIIDGWGFQARIAGLNNAKIHEAMKVLASKSKGVIPKRGDVSNAITARAKEFDWGAAIKYTATESAKQITRGVQDVGKSVITTMKVGQFLMPLIPIVLLAAVYMGVKGRVGGAGGAGMGEWVRQKRKQLKV